MKVNLRRQITKLKNITLQTIVQEAVVNAMQAKASRIAIEFTQVPTLLNDEVVDENRLFLIIKDNGTGFTAADSASFSTLGSEKKLMLGALGVGRLTYLSLFKHVEIKGICREENTKFFCDFTDQYEEKDFVRQEDHSNLESYTELRFYGVKSDLDKFVDIKKMKEELFIHILPMLYLQKNSSTIITLKNEEETQQISSKDLDEYAFKIANFSIEKNQINYGFELHYGHSLTAGKGKTYAYYSAHERTVKPFPSEIYPPAIKGKTYFFFLKSPYFDENINDERNEFLIKNASDQKDTYPNWEEIDLELSKVLKTIIYDSEPHLKKEDTQAVDRLIYHTPHIARYIDPYQIGVSTQIDKVVDKAEKRALDEKLALMKKLKVASKMKNKEALYEELKEVVAVDLARYIEMRDQIITQLEDFAQNNHQLEKDIHNLFMKKAAEGSEECPIPLEDNNLWLLDDKFMSYSYAASEKQIKKILEAVDKNSGDSSSDRADIVIYKNSEQQDRAVLIELKKFSAKDFESGKGILQLMKYAKQLLRHDVKEVYCYLITKINRELEETLNSLGAKNIYSARGSMYILSSHAEPVNIVIISPEAIISDARCRNKTFLDILRKNAAQKIKPSEKEH